MKTTFLVLSLTTLLLYGCGNNEDQSAKLSTDEIQQLTVQSEAFIGQDLAQLQASPSAMALGKQLYTGHCATCHGSDAKGAKGIANLVNGVYDFGSSASAIRHTISQGRQSIMPGLGTVLGEVDLGLLVAYVMSFSGQEFDAAYMQSARKLYEDSCLSCHGENGLGNKELGIPDLTDAYWQHGDSKMNVRLNVTRGINSECPPHADVLTSTEIELLTAYLLTIREENTP